MNNYCLKFLKVFLFFGILNSGVLLAEEQHVNLQKCVSIALQNHPLRLQRIEDYKINISRYKMARAKRSMIINGQIRTIQTDNEGGGSSKYKIPGVDSDIGLYGGVSMGYKIFDAKATKELKASRLGIDLSKVVGDKVVQGIILGVKKAYFAYLQSLRAYEIQKSIHKKYETKLKLAQKLFKNGSRPMLDVSKSQVDLANSQLDLNKAKNWKEKLKRNLFDAMGLEASSDYDIVPEEFEILPVLSTSLKNINILAEIYSPDIRMVKIQKRIAKINVEAKKAGHLPVVNLSMGVGYKLEKFYGIGSGKFNKNVDSDEWLPVVYVLFNSTIPIYSGGAISSMVDASRSNYNKVVYEEKEIRARVKADIRDSYHRLSEIQKQIEVSKLVIKNAERHLLLAQRSYEYGASSILNLQDAELGVQNAKMGAVKYKYDYLLTLARLCSIAGVKENMICK